MKRDSQEEEGQTRRIPETAESQKRKNCYLSPECSVLAVFSPGVEEKVTLQLCYRDLGATTIQ